MRLIRWKYVLLSIFLSTVLSSESVASLVALLSLVWSGTELTVYNTFLTLSFINIVKGIISSNLARPIILLADFSAALLRIQTLLEIPRPNRANSLDAKATEKEDIRVGENRERAQLPRSPAAPTAQGTTSFGSPGLGITSVEKSIFSSHLNTRLSLSNVTCYWSRNSPMPTLKSINLDVSSSEVLFVTGTVGCGKSSLLLAILQELSLVKGSISCTGNIAYVPQKSWIFSGTVRENILFGQPMEHERYNRVIGACDLQRDMEKFPDGDLTVIGVRGVLLSGGQRRRVDLARAAYSNADVFLLDDPLSAVDAAVGNHIFVKCIMGLLACKTRIVVTHCPHFLKNASRIIVMKEGRITEEGSYSELREAGVEFEASDEKYQANNSAELPLPYDEIEHSGKEDWDENEVSGLEVVEEDRMVGPVSRHLYCKFFKTGLWTPLIIALAVFCVLVQGKQLHIYIYNPKFISCIYNMV